MLVTVGRGAMLGKPRSLVLMSVNSMGVGTMLLLFSALLFGHFLGFVVVTGVGPFDAHDSGVVLGIPLFRSPSDVACISNVVGYIS